MMPSLTSGWPSFADSPQHAQVAGDRQLAAAAEREALDRRDHRRRELLDAVEDAAVDRLQRVARGALAQLRDVGPGGERLVAGPGDHQGRDGLVVPVLRRAPGAGRRPSAGRSRCAVRARSA
jgi:hypothetical protein